MNSNSSELLLRRYRSGNSDAEFELHERYHARLISLARSRLMGILSSKVAPDDISQETFMAFFEKLALGRVQWNRQGDLWRLLAGIAINKVRNRFEFHSAEKRHFGLESDLEIRQLSTPALAETPETTAELADLVENLLEAEKPMTKTILSMRLAGHTSDEIASRIGRTSRTVRRILEALKAKIVDSNLFDYQWLQPNDLRQSLTQSSSHPQRVQPRLSEFQLLRMIGEGSFAKVYLARHQNSGELVAIKSLRKKWLANSAARQAFMREAKTIEKLTHKNIVRLHGICKPPNGGCFLILDLIQGCQLAAASETASINQNILWFTEIADALTEVHKAGISHGDLKMKNIMIDADQHVRIFDFGLAQSEVRSSILEAKSQDIYDVGVIMSELLESHPTANSSMNPLKKSQIDQLAHSCIHRVASERPSSNDVLRTLKNISKRD